MKHILGYRCTICGKEFPYTELMTCPDCGEKGILDIVFDYDYIKKNTLSREKLANCRDNSMWRYKALMPLKDRDFTPFLRVGWTPLYKSNRLGDAAPLSGKGGNAAHPRPGGAFLLRLRPLRHRLPPPLLP